MLFGVSRFLFKGWVQQLYIDPQFYFGYLGFEWVKPLPGNWMYLPFILMLLAAIGITIGYLYRYSAFVFFLCFTYVELLDKSNYLNHYYFVSLMSFLMMLVPANAKFSVDALRNPSIRRDTTSQWHIGILKFQLAVVYIFAGIAKLNSDWLFHAEPLRTWLQAHHTIPFFGQFLQMKETAYLFSWFGCLYDLFIVFFLLTAKTRKFAYLFVVGFHLITWYLFPIGVFPWVMIFSTLIFFSNEFHEKVLAFLKRMLRITQQENVAGGKSSGQTNPLVLTFLVIYMAAQITLPFRYTLYPGDLFWNEEGFRFSWRVMLMHKEGYATFYVKDKATGRTAQIDNTHYLTQTQIDQMSTQPDMILQYARFLKTKYDGRTFSFGEKEITITDPSVHAEVYVSLNGRPSQLFIDRKHDLTTLPYNLSHRNWIEPFTP